MLDPLCSKMTLQHGFLIRDALVDLDGGDHGYQQHDPKSSADTKDISSLQHNRIV